LHFQLAMTRSRQQKYDLAIVQFEESLRQDARQPLALNGLAIALLDSAEPIRDPVKALQLAQQACVITQMKYPGMLRTLARAYAAMENFTEAVNVTSQALALANAAGDATLAEELRAQLEAFKQKSASGTR
jgi:hypothetical protein